MYCSLDDLKKQVQEDTLIQLTDDSQSSHIDSSIVEEAVIYSETLIDGYLRGRYVLPLLSVPAVIKVLAVDLSIYRLYSRRFQTETSDAVSDKYKNSIKILEQIQRGIISLGIETTGKSQELGEYRTNKSIKDREFNKLNEY